MSDVFVFPSPEEVPVSPGSVTVFMSDCLEVLTKLRDRGERFDAIITDPPYEIAYMGKGWDNTGIAFSSDLWSLVYELLNPGGFIAAFAAPRMYHRLAVAVEDAGFKLYPYLSWQFQTGLQKPVNVSELFDRDNVPDRKPVGARKGSGYTTAKVKHGVQNLTKNEFPVYERGVSEEARQWDGWYYGLNCFKPTMEPIALAQKPIDHKRAIDNIRAHGTGALNLKALGERHNGWPTTILSRKKARYEDHESDHPSVKPVDLMGDLCVLTCPPGGRILDMFGGTGTTAEAAAALGFDCVLIESNHQMRPVIERRLGKALLPQPVFCTHD